MTPHSEFLLVLNENVLALADRKLLEEYTIAFQVEVTKKFSLVIITSVLKQHEGYFGTDLVILNIGQMTRMTPKLARSSPNFRTKPAPSVLLPGFKH
ncbi:hypothetical protein AVEN_214546-1 [Araneus ventricosus]|uniref:Uncharacterized protein n=1 Tax=Araneus ventricosus TaxID=182803 RepID=A0A4Y2E5G9_ARAVE|nr:hypothetical protein AVEN_214546-1 [Araneus ventricosus]